MSVLMSVVCMALSLDQNNSKYAYLCKCCDKNVKKCCFKNYNCNENNFENEMELKTLHNNGNGNKRNYGEPTANTIYSNKNDYILFNEITLTQNEGKKKEFNEKSDINKFNEFKNGFDVNDNDDDEISNTGIIEVSGTQEIQEKNDRLIQKNMAKNEQEIYKITKGWYKYETPK